MRSARARVCVCVCTCGCWIARPAHRHPQIDAIGTKRFNSDQSGDREVQRTMLELLNQLDGFTSNTKIKVGVPRVCLCTRVCAPALCVRLYPHFDRALAQVIAATNRPDTLDPALLRSGRLDRKIELPLPTEDARARIMQIHSRKMNVDKEGGCCLPSPPPAHPHACVRALDPPECAVPRVCVEPVRVCCAPCVCVCECFRRHQRACAPCPVCVCVCACGFVFP